jgi:hypothetical protein
MDRTTLEARLRVAARQAVEYARRYVLEELPNEAMFRVYPNRSFDKHPLVGDEVVFPGDSLPEGAFHGPWSVGQVVEFLWRGGKVPEWIDVTVEDVGGSHTVMSLLCCGRFTSQDDLLYHRDGGRPPFSVKSLAPAPSWEGIETSGKYRLRWLEEERGTD